MTHFAAQLTIDQLNKLPAFRERMIGKYITYYPDDLRRQLGHVHYIMTPKNEAKRLVPTLDADGFEFAPAAPVLATIGSHLDVHIRQSVVERLGLYALVTGLQPAAMLEIGSAEGGSAAIAVRAMDAVAKGRLFCIDPEPNIAPEVWASIQHRATMLIGFSPHMTAEAAQMAQMPFDLVFIDGDHSEPSVIADFEGCLPFLADTAYLLFHDSYNPGVQKAIDKVVLKHSHVLQDCGILFRSRYPLYDQWWFGMRLVAFSRQGFLQPR